MQKRPNPISPPAIVGTIQWMVALNPVQPNQKSPPENATPPMIAGETPFGNGDAVVGIELPDIPWLEHDDEKPSDELPNDHTKIGKPAHALVESVDLLENNRICRHEQV